MSGLRSIVVWALFFGCLMLSEYHPSLGVLAAYVLGIFAFPAPEAKP